MPEHQTSQSRGRQLVTGLAVCVVALSAGLVLGSRGASTLPSPTVTVTQTERASGIGQAERVRTWTRPAQGDLAEGWLTGDDLTPGVYDGIVASAQWSCGWFIIPDQGDMIEGSGSPTAAVTIADDDWGFSSRNCLWRLRAGDHGG